MDLDNPNTTLHPLYPTLEAPLEFELGPGDVLYLTLTLTLTLP